MAEEGMSKQWLHQYVVVGRKQPSEAEPEPQVFRMKIFAQNTVVAKSRFWFYLRQLRKVKKANGEILAVEEVFEKDPGTIKNFGVWLRYKSRSDTVNMYKEFRDTHMTRAVEQMYLEMSGNHRARWSSIQVLKVQEVANEDCRRERTLQMLDESNIKFPLPHRVQRSYFKKHRSTFKSRRPVTVISN
uniref:60S ribosomal protein L18a n=1 Tax=Erythrolobus madagascarensis TaxID=708628 RepID=A0A7S0T4C8_9RHOD|mmetsp:Transcript_2314/g.5217  ORF Transcript_2314/g.5217 Transcript_2314/m.5217 type:complete len:187 (+) Transcript_2314:47-607(+)